MTTGELVEGRTATADPQSTPLRPKFPADDGFYAELRRRVTDYFRQSGRRERDNWSMYLKSAIIVTWLATSYVLLAFFAEHWYQAIPLAFSVAFAMSAVGFSIQHDGGHRAYSRYGWINRLAARSLDLIGASSYLWHFKHGVIHHTYTNVAGVDTDIELGAIIRTAPHQKRRWFHRWQHLYLFPLYGLTASRWHLYGDFKEIAAGQMGPHRVPRPKGSELGVFLFGKFLSIALFIGIPLFFHDVITVLGFYFGITCVMGITMSIVFQLAHCVEEASFPVADPDTNRLNDSWAIHQVETTVDFARQNRMLSWWLGGLNFQIEHHLFPQICHVHYPEISKIVEKTCQEYGVRYQAHPTFTAGLRSHYRWLRRMGERPQTAQTAA